MERAVNNPVAHKSQITDVNDGSNIDGQICITRLLRCNGAFLGGDIFELRGFPAVLIVLRQLVWPGFDMKDEECKRQNDANTQLRDGTTSDDENNAHKCQLAEPGATRHSTSQCFVGKCCQQR